MSRKEEQEDLEKMISFQIEKLENLPFHAMEKPLTHYDLLLLLRLFSSVIAFWKERT